MMSNLAFTNSKTGTKTKILRSKDNETEQQAKERLVEAGWKVDTYTFDQKRRIFYKK